MRYLVTSALPYINGIKHLVNLVGSMLPADVYSRFLRARGEKVLYICATDEHGTPAELAAQAANMPVDLYCAEQHERQYETLKAFGIKFDHFGRSSSTLNRKLTQAFARALGAQGYIERRTDRQFFSITDNRFLPDRYIEGTCPRCGHKARGDQCDGCGALLDPVDLIHPYSALSGSYELELRDTEHLYLLLSKLQDRVRAWVDERAPQWSTLTRGIAYKHLDEGLKDRAITRDLSWGVPVDWPGMENKVFYVWFDAPLAYVSATEEWGDRWWDWWLSEDENHPVKYVQVMGKDNVPFHTATFPATILGAGSDLKTADIIKSFNWLDWYGEKFSTSEKRGVFMDQALELYPADYWRWYLLVNAPETSDTTFTWDQFQTAVNKDLADALGNFVNRITRFIRSKFADGLPPVDDATEDERALSATINGLTGQFTQYLDDFEIGNAARKLRSIWMVGNEYVTRLAPWSMIKAGDILGAARVCRTALNLVRHYTIIGEPFLPFTSETLRAYVGGEVLSWPNDDFDPLRPVTLQEDVPILFEKISAEKMVELEAKFPKPTQ